MTLLAMTISTLIVIVLLKYSYFTLGYGKEILQYIVIGIPSLGGTLWHFKDLSSIHKYNINVRDLWEKIPLGGT